MFELCIQAIVLERLSPKIQSLIDLNDSSVYDDNLLQIEVYFNDFDYQSINEYPAYTVSIK